MNNEFNSTTKKNNYIYNDNKNRVKNNNYINVFDSCNNLNNYFFQFQSPSTVINFDDNKKINNYFLTKANRQNKNRINIISNSSPFSLKSKLYNKEKNIFNSKDLKPNNLLNNLKNCLSEKKPPIKSEIKTKLKNMYIGEFKFNSNNLKDIYISKPKNKNKIVIQNLLPSFNKENNNYIILDNKLNNLTNSIFHRTFCYFRILNLNNTNKIYNPLENIFLSQLCKSPYNFIKSTLQFNKKEDTINIFPSVQLESIKIKIEKIERAFINSDMKIAIDIFLRFKKYKNLCVNEDNNRFIKEIKKGNIIYNHLKDEEIKRYCNNKYFVFTIIIKNEKKIEFLFCSYEEFILWNNAISFFIKNNNNQFLYNLSNRNNFEYP